VLQYEDVVRHTALRLSTTFAFLGLDPTVTIANSSRVLNRGLHPIPTLTSSVRGRLVDLYAPDLKDLLAIVPDLDTSLWPSFT
jgi:hypothetical protein